MRKRGKRENSVQLCDDLDAAVDAQRAAVEGEVIVLGMAPLHIGVEPVIGGPALVFFPEALFGGFFPLTVDFHNPLGAEIQIGMDENPQTVGCIPEDVVGAAAHNQAGPFLGQIGDDLILDLPEVVGIAVALKVVGKGEARKPPVESSPASCT